MKKVLVVAYHYPPIRGSGDRTFWFTNYLKDFGYLPTVLCATPGGRGDLRYGSVAHPILRAEGVEAVRAYHAHNLITRALYKLGLLPYDNLWFIPAYLAARKLVRREKFDLVFASGPGWSAFIVAWLIKKEAKIPLVLDFRDPWKNDVWGLRSRAIKAADLIVTVTEAVRAELKKLTPKKIHVIPNGVAPTFGVKNKVPEKFTIVYSGSTWPRFRLGELLDAVAASGKGIRLLVFGKPYRELEGYAKQKGIDARFFGHIERKEMLRKMANASWGYDGSNFEVAIPSKVYEYCGLGIPVISFTPPGSAAERFVREWGIGLVANTQKELERSILAAYRGGKQLQAKYAENTHAVVEKFNRKSLTADLAGLFDSLLSGKEHAHP